MAAIGLIHGTLAAHDYEDEAAADPRIDALRAKMTVMEDKRYSREYLEPARRTNANAIQVHFADGTSTQRMEVECPLGHPARREEAMPLLRAKFEKNVARVFADKAAKTIVAACADKDRLAEMPIDEFMDLMVV
jgi:2-methylcitrate dehydratase PrpD